MVLSIISHTTTVSTMATRMPQLAVGHSLYWLIKSLLSRVLALAEMFFVASAVPSLWMAGMPAMKLER